MISKLIRDQLNKTIYADLSNFDELTNTYFIKKREDVKIEEDNFYLIHLKMSAFTNKTISDNWNAGSIPPVAYMKIDASKVMGKMVKVLGAGFDIENNRDLSVFWSGWLCVDDIEVLYKI